LAQIIAFREWRLVIMQQNIGQSMDAKRARSINLIAILRMAGSDVNEHTLRMPNWRRL